MILRIPGLEAWQNGVGLGFFPREILCQPARVWKSARGAKWVELPSLKDDFSFHETVEKRLSPVEGRDIAQRLGYVIKEEPPGGASQTVDFLWALFEPHTVPKPRLPGPDSPLILQFSGAKEAVPFLLELLRQENHGEIRFQEAAGHLWISIHSLSRYLFLKWQESLENKSVLLFEQEVPGLWLESGWSHPLKRNWVGAGGNQVLVERNNQIHILEIGSYRPLFESVKWLIGGACLNESMPASKELLFQFPLKLVETKAPGPAGIPDLWVLQETDLSLLSEWVQWITPEVRQAFRFGILKKDPKEKVGNESEDVRIVLYRVREVFQGALGDIPGKAFGQSNQLPGLFLPVRTKIIPDPGPVYLRKLMGLEQLDRFAWVETGDKGGLVPFVFPAKAMGGWEILVRFELERERSTWKQWTESFTFAWDTIPRVALDNQVASGSRSLNANPVPIVESQEKKRRTKEGEISSSSKESKNLPVSQLTDSINRDQEHHHLLKESGPEKKMQKDPSRELLKEFEDSALPWDSSLRVEILKKLSTAWVQEKQFVWAAKSWLIASWNENKDPWSTTWGNQLLVSWHQSEAAHQNLPALPDLVELLDRIKGAVFPLGRMNWFLTGLILWGKKEPGGSFLLEEFQNIQQVLAQQGPFGSYRLVNEVWRLLASIQKDSLIGTRGGERQLFSLLELGLNLKEEWPEPLLGRGGDGGAFRDRKEGLAGLLKSISSWMASFGQTEKSCMTLSMVRWTFAYGMARIGAIDEARELARSASKILESRELGAFLNEAYSFRIDQAIVGKPASGSLPGTWLTRVAQLGGIKAFPLDYTREMSQILEPHQSVHPFRSALMKNPLDETVDPDRLAQLCEARVSAQDSLDPVKAISSWMEVLDRVLLLPGFNAHRILEKANRFFSFLTVEKPDYLKLGMRLLMGNAYFQREDRDFQSKIIKALEDPVCLSSWLGGTRTLGMNKEFFLFCVRCLPILAQLEWTSWVEVFFNTVGRTLGSLGDGPVVSHFQFLLKVSRLRFFPLENDSGAWRSLEQQLRDESRQLSLISQRRNEPWLAYCCKLVGFIHAAGGRGPGFAISKLNDLMSWLLPLKDHFATSPDQANKGPAGFSYHRYQLEWIEALVLAICETTEPRTSTWGRSDEALVRRRIRMLTVESNETRGNLV